MTATAAIAKVPAVYHVETDTVLYALQPKQFDVFRLTSVYRRDETPYARHIGCGGAAGGGKSYLARAVLTAVALAWPGSATIIFRGTEKEVETNHVIPFLGEVPVIIDGQPLYRYNGEKMQVQWANGSWTHFGFLRSDRDVFTYLGASYDCEIFDEATTYTEFQ